MELTNVNMKMTTYNNNKKNKRFFGNVNFNETFSCVIFVYFINSLKSNCFENDLSVSSVTQLYDSSKISSHQHFSNEK